MDKKKLVKYTQWLLFEMEITPIQNKKVSKKIVNEFLKKHPEFLDKLNQDFTNLEFGKYKNEDKIPESDKFWNYVNIDMDKESVRDFISALTNFDKKPNNNPQPLDEYHDWSFHGKKKDDPTEELFEKRTPNVYVVTTTGLFPNFWPRFF